ncbi:DUF3108 domain-containing protein [Neisseria chenwenguii]|uniref:DUF3108 domain-containing protein n=1 Tax=Neisseria chenwenguii TaxID=1853278 RepID=A0A220RZ78_9NEIS|nr:DUF3108 domain-containing protein [Neisseria chenwenguii]ASK26530.1 DUF3108 domain-containing protein [Neisseria chenwenguii]ROV55972.1 DUF3108 domain-containing protein [Neisseria chenwenguii]
MHTPTRTAVLILAATLSLPAFSAELPKSAVLQFSGSYGIPATMTFNRSGSSYKIVSTVKVPLYRIRFESGGTVSGNSLKPRYYKEIRNGKLYASAKFSGGKVSYGKAGEEKTQAVSGTTMDLFTLAWQLAANDARLPAGLRVTNGKKIYPIAGMSKTGSAQYKFSGGTTPVDRYVVHRGNDVITYAFASKINHIPAQISFTDDYTKTYNLKLTGVKINGKAVKP